MAPTDGIAAAVNLAGAAEGMRWYLGSELRLCVASNDRDVWVRGNVATPRGDGRENWVGPRSMYAVILMEQHDDSAVCNNRLQPGKQRCVSPQSHHDRQAAPYTPSCGCGRRRRLPPACVQRGGGQAQLQPVAPLGPGAPAMHAELPALRRGRWSATQAQVRRVRRVPGRAHTAPHSGLPPLPAAHHADLLCGGRRCGGRRALAARVDCRRDHATQAAAHTAPIKGTQPCPGPPQPPPSPTLAPS